MPRIYRLSRRPVKARVVNPLLLPKTPAQPAHEPEPVPVPEQEPSVEPSTDWTLAELKAAADEKGVASYGTKAEIVARLTDG
jgi:hypothetical protein